MPLECSYDVRITHIEFSCDHSEICAGLEWVLEFKQRSRICENDIGQPSAMYANDNLCTYQQLQLVNPRQVFEVDCLKSPRFQNCSYSSFGLNGEFSLSCLSSTDVETLWCVSRFLRFLLWQPSKMRSRILSNISPFGCVQ